MKFWYEMPADSEVVSRFGNYEALDEPEDSDFIDLCEWELVLAGPQESSK